jgi:hypothetical protein
MLTRAGHVPAGSRQIGLKLPHPHKALHIELADHAMRCSGSHHGTTCEITGAVRCRTNTHVLVPDKCYGEPGKKFKDIRTKSNYQATLVAKGLLQEDPLNRTPAWDPQTGKFPRFRPHTHDPQPC